MMAEEQQMNNQNAYKAGQITKKHDLHRQITDLQNFPRGKYCRKAQ
jgi:hypothetical protein